MKRIVNALLIAFSITGIAFLLCSVLSAQIHGNLKSSDIVYNSLDYQIVQDGDDFHITQDIDLTQDAKNRTAGPALAGMQSSSADPRCGCLVRCADDQVTQGEGVLRVQQPRRVRSTSNPSNRQGRGGS